MQKRYQRYLIGGEIGWTPWFRVPANTPKEEWQLKGKLKNEYRD